jgi:hypothetical protein
MNKNWMSGLNIYQIYLEDCVILIDEISINNYALSRKHLLKSSDKSDLHFIA